MTDTPDFTERAERFAEALEKAGVVVDTEPRPQGVHVWVVDGGVGLGYFPDEVTEETEPSAAHAHCFFDFRLMDCFTMDAISEDHRHYREDAAIFLNLVFDEYLAAREGQDVSDAFTSLKKAGGD